MTDQEGAEVLSAARPLVRRLQTQRNAAFRTLAQAARKESAKARTPQDRKLASRRIAYLLRLARSGAAGAKLSHRALSRALARANGKPGEKR